MSLRGSNYFYVTRLMEDPENSEIPLALGDVNRLQAGDLLRVTYFNEPVSETEALEQIPVKDSLGLSALYLFDRIVTLGRRRLIRLVSFTDLPGSPQFRRLISSPPHGFGQQIDLHIANACDAADSREQCERLNCRWLKSRNKSRYHCSGTLKPGWFKTVPSFSGADGFNWPRNFHGYGGSDPWSW